MTWFNKYIKKSKKGLQRISNQDRIFIINNADYKIFMLFDGVSSNPNSFKFINSYIKEIKNYYSKNPFDSEKINEILFEAHKQVLEKEIDGQSTMSAVFVENKTSKVYYVNIGDSRIYDFSNQYIEKLTKDDSSEYQKNLLTDYLGRNSITIDSFTPKEIHEFKNLLICSDGFYNLMENNLREYFSTINFKYLSNIEKKISTLQKRKNNDDSSYILIKNEV